ncbi:PEP-CTERM sorting domain-containing protein [Desulfonema magnum]|uniref:PEP-CTERM protein-sorting domain-containing protein n=1 Tax=Desulfonema magnum TaxID=45655 RepID=A0A975BLH2_9BACT|nr:PEP-CTERM sorting domain-containing protein [Desulfonema magnum]QTA87772.1 PEP-CTERM protein-sorting domain-containing protein [Desulfonema magnum]
MRKFSEILIVLALAVFLSAGSAFAYGTQITISDENYEGTGWYSNREDQETEVGMQANQSWDLEGWFLDGTSLTMVGGYDFVNGNQDLYSGDVFIDVDADSAIFGDIDGEKKGNFTVQETYGYDYVLDMNFNTSTYDVYQLTDTTTTITSLEWQNQGSNPWRYDAGGTLISSNNTFNYQTGLTDAETGFEGGNHNVVSGLDLSFIASDVPVEFITHFTMQCGNDNLMGQGTLAAVEAGGGGGSAATPEPATMFLLGAGLVGVAVMRKRFDKKN